MNFDDYDLDMCQEDVQGIASWVKSYSVKYMGTIHGSMLNGLGEILNNVSNMLASAIYHDDSEDQKNQEAIAEECESCSKYGEEPCHQYQGDADGRCRNFEQRLSEQAVQEE